MQKERDTKGNPTTLAQEVKNDYEKFLHEANTPILGRNGKTYHYLFPGSVAEIMMQIKYGRRTSSLLFQMRHPRLANLLSQLAQVPGLAVTMIERTKRPR